MNVSRQLIATAVSDTSVGFSFCFMLVFHWNFKFSVAYYLLERYQTSVYTHSNSKAGLSMLVAQLSCHCFCD